MRRHLWLLTLLLPVASCLAIYHSALRTWFFMDDYAWLGMWDEIHDLPSFFQVLFRPQAQGSAESIRVARWMVAWTLRSLGRLDDALAMQLALEQERATVERPSPYVFAELAELYRAKGDAARADEYAQLKARLDG